MRAGDERIEVAATRRIEQLGEARVANRHVGRDRGARRAVLFAFADDERALARHERARLRFDAIDARERGCLCDEIADKGVNRALHFNQDAVLVVEGKAGEIVARRQPPDMRAKADTLHQTAHAQPQTARNDGSRAMADVEAHALVHA